MVETQRTKKIYVEFEVIKNNFQILNLRRAVLISLLFFVIINGISFLLLGELPGAFQIIYTALVSALAGMNIETALGTKKGTAVASGGGSLLAGGGSLLAGVFSAIVSYAGCAGCLLPIFASVFGAGTASSISQFSVEFKIPIMVGTIFLLSAFTIWNLRKSKPSCCNTCSTGLMKEEEEEKNNGENRVEKIDSTKVRVELLYWEECPNWKIALNTLKETLEEIEREKGGKIKFEVSSIKVETDELAKKLRFPGSPTVRVMGEDVWEKDEEGEIYGLTCRVYRVEGKMMPFLPKDILKKSVEKILSDKGVW